MSSNAIPMTAEDIAQLREVVRRAGGSKEAASALGINVATLARALASLPVMMFSAAYIRASLPRTLEKLPGGPGIERTG